MLIPTILIISILTIASTLTMPIPILSDNTDNGNDTKNNTNRNTNHNTNASTNPDINK
jgi:hypothetical protein